MAEKDPSARLRRAVKEGNLFLVKRLIQRTDMRNTDPTGPRYTSLAWAAVMGHEEVFDFLLTNGHDDEELSKDSENNTLLILLAGMHSGVNSPYRSSRDPDGLQDAALRMARSYHERFPFILDWSNMQGKTALHSAALKGNEDFVAMLCELHADLDLADVIGNTALHYASAWGHLPVVKLLIEGGCQFVARNNEGYTASDYAYSHHTKEMLEDAARAVYDAKKNARRPPYAQMRGMSLEEERTVPPRKDWRRSRPRLRSGSATTATSDSADELVAQPAHSQSSVSSAASVPSSNGSMSRAIPSPRAAVSVQSDTPRQPHSAGLGVTPTTHHALSPIASRVLANDAGAMAEYMKRNRSGSTGETPRSNLPAHPTPPIMEEPIAQKYSLRRLRPSLSAAALRTQPPAPLPPPGTNDQRSRFRAGTNPSPSLRPQFSPPAVPPADDIRRTGPTGPLPSLPEPPALPPKDDPGPRTHRRGPSIT